MKKKSIIVTLLIITMICAMAVCSRIASVPADSITWGAGVIMPGMNFDATYPASSELLPF